MAEHSKLGASSYYRWAACPGSVALSEGMPNESSVYAQEGTLAHEIAGEILKGNGPPTKPDDEMAEAITVYLEYVGTLRDARPTFESVEQKFDLSKYHPTLFGTADYVAYFANTKTLHVVDYKHGKGISVDVKRNSQLMYYGLGALHANKVPVETVVLTIVQPRCYHPDGPVRSWETDSIDMLEFAATLVEDALATEKPNAPLKAGDHCRFCPAQPTCPQIQNQALEIASAAFQDERTGSLARYEPAKLAHVLTLLPQIESWCKSVREFAYQQATLGVEVPGFKLVGKRASRRWAENAEDGLSLIFTDEFLYDKKLRSPAQLEKILPEKEQKKLLEQFTIKESSGKNLVSVNDDRAPSPGMFQIEKEET